MALDQNVLRSMKQIARMMPDQIDGMLRELATKSPEEWRQGTNLILLTLWARTTNILKMLQEAVATQTGTNGTAPAAPQEPVMGADGAPITDPDQLEAERMMNASAGPRGGVPPGPAPKSRPAAPAVRTGADGQPITDPAQLEAENILDQVAGPR